VLKETRCGTDVDAAEVAGVEDEYLRYFAARLERRRRPGPGRGGGGGAAPSPDGSVELAGGGDGRAVEGHLPGVGDDGGGRRRRRRRRRAERERRVAVAGGRHRRLVEHADESDGDAHALRTHAQEPDEAEQRHRETTREPEPRHCTETIQLHSQIKSKSNQIWL